MELGWTAGELQVSEGGLRDQASWCEALATRLATNSAPAGAGSSPLASSAAVNISHAQVVAAGMRCAIRMQTTAAKLAAASDGYGSTEASSAAQLRELWPATVC
jgi:hypothetical protein